MRRTHLEIQCKRRDVLWDKLVDAMANGESEEVIKLYEDELNYIENDIHDMLYKEIKEEREKDRWKI